MEILILIASGVMCISCFLIGAKVGQSVSRGEKIETPAIIPVVKLAKKDRATIAAEAESKRIETIMRNIDRYDGTSRGQEDVPR
jgi:hypothetical protein